MIRITLDDVYLEIHFDRLMIVEIGKEIIYYANRLRFTTNSVDMYNGFIACGCLWVPVKMTFIGPDKIKLTKLSITARHQETLIW